MAGVHTDAYLEGIGTVRETARNRYVVGAQLPGLTMFERVVLDAAGEGAHVVILCCEDDAGHRFSYLGPMSSVDRIGPGEPFVRDRDGPAYPVYRASWPRWPEDRTN